MKASAWILVCAAGLGGCTVGEVSRAPTAGDRATKAIVTPLADLNLVREKIPEVLLQAKDAPYRVPAKRVCEALAQEIGALDHVLGPDLDAPKKEAGGWVDRGVGEIGEAAWGALEGAASSLVPYRGWVRKLTGAERRSKEVAAAIAAGIVRRAYLKGIGQNLGCEPPAAPLPKPEEPVQPSESASRSDAEA